MMMPFNAANWYWAVGGSATQVWSSAACAYVPVTDTAYLAWVAAGRRPTPIDSAASLYDVLLAQWAPAAQSAGVQVTSTGTPALNGTYDIDDKSVAYITALSTGIAAGKPLPGGGTTFNYPDASNVMRAFSSADFLNFAAAVEGFIYNFEQSLLILLNGGSATMPTPALTIA